MRRRSYFRLCAAGAVVAGVAAAIAAAGVPAVTAAARVPAVTAAARAPAVAAPSSPIRHVVVIYLENHSFDNVLGFWCDQNPRRCPDGGMPSFVRLSDGAEVAPGADPDRVPDVNHNGPAQVAAMNGGKMNGWENIPGGQCDAANGYRCISGYEPGQIPNFTTLADQFAISDMTFSLSDSPSWIGHIYAVAASTDGFWGNNPEAARGVRKGPGWGCDSNRLAWWYASPDSKKQDMPSCIPDFSLGLKHGGAFAPTKVSNIPTIMDRLNGAHLSWKIYGATPGTKGYGVYDVCPTFAQCLDTGQASDLVPDSRFTTDASAGELPAFSLITPGGSTFQDSCHNVLSMTACDNWVGRLVNAVEQGPDWFSTAVFITFDDFGGFYDQVYPGTNSNPDLTQQGPRVPVIIVSPYVKRGYTDTTHTTFAGILAYTEHNFGLAPLGANDADAYDFRNAFNYAQAPLAPVPMVSRPLPLYARHLRITKAVENDPS